MKRILALALMLGTGAVATQAPAAEAGFSDPICTQATKPVREYFDKTKNPATTLDTAVELAQKVIDAYDLCASENATNNSVDNLQYAHLSAAQYQYVLGGWQHLAGNEGLARAALERSVKLAQDIIDWRPPSQIAYGSNDVNVGQGSVHNTNAGGVSKFHDDAVKVRDAALKSISLLPKPGAPAPAPSAT
jgi:hypothetical protein